MTLQHVADHAGGFVVRCTSLDADRFGDRHLHMIDIPAVPERLEEPVPEPKYEDILDCLFAEVMIDTIDLVFRQNAVNLFTQCARTAEIMPERFLEDHARPRSFTLVRCDQPRIAERLGDQRKLAGRRREIEKAIALRAGLFVNRIETFAQFPIRLIFVVTAGFIEEVLLQLAPDRLVDRLLA